MREWKPKEKRKKGVSSGQATEGLAVIEFHGLRAGAASQVTEADFEDLHLTKLQPSTSSCRIPLQRNFASGLPQA
jgi:hypothetical protein